MVVACFRLQTTGQGAERQCSRSDANDLEGRPLRFKQLLSVPAVILSTTYIFGLCGCRFNNFSPT